MSFGKMPIANCFLSENEFHNEYFFELAPAFCAHCKMFQLINQPEPNLMFHDSYAFFSGTSKKMTIHFQKFAEHLIHEFLVREKVKDPFVVELGSNDGIMLKNFSEKNIKHLGVEPSNNVAEKARQNGVNTICNFFNEESAAKILKEYGRAKIICAANVMCHIPNLHSVTKGVNLLLNDQGVFVFEDPYLLEMLKKTAYDQIYDEHVFIFSVQSVINAFQPYGLEVFHVESQMTHGGSMRYYLCHKGAYPIKNSVQEQVNKELAAGLDLIITYQSFKKSCEESKIQLVGLLTKLRLLGKKVVGYAATSKSTTVLNYCNIGPDLLEYISDTTLIKQGKFSPGMHIPIKPYDEFAKNNPDYAVLFAWNHSQEIFENEKTFIEKGGRWISFVPDVKVLQGTNQEALCSSNPKEQFVSNYKEIMHSIETVCNSPSYILGSEVQKFEEEFSHYNGAQYTVGVGSGTDALILSLKALNIGIGDEVITVSHTALATVAAIIAVGATPVLIDIEPNFYTIDPEKLTIEITSKTKAIIPVHLYGQPCNMDVILEVARINNLYVIEDCAQAHGAKYKNQRVGTFGNVGCFSFYPTKNLGAMGDGGAVISNDINIINRIRRLRQYGWDENRVSQEPGIVSRLDELQAAILRVKLKYLDLNNEKRRKISAYYSDKLKSCALVLPQERIAAMSVYHLYVIQTKKRDKLQEHLLQFGVNASIHYSMLTHEHPGFRTKVKLARSGVPVSENIVTNILSLPMYPELNDYQIDSIIEAIKVFS